MIEARREAERRAAEAMANTDARGSTSAGLGVEPEVMGVGLGGEAIHPS
jgi:hypothetical protein